MGHICRLIRSLSNIGAVIAGTAVLFMILLITIEVIGRRVLGFSTLIADEFSGYLLVAITFMGSAYTFRNEGFTRMDVIYNYFKGKGRWAVNVVLNLVSLVFLLITGYWMWVHILSTYRNSMKSISIFQTPLYVPMLFMGVGITLLLLEVLLEILTLFISVKTDQPTGASS
jgi:TRAP-type C4-dicarboxylate transport system permease small subunit